MLFIGDCYREDQNLGTPIYENIEGYLSLFGGKLESGETFLEGNMFLLNEQHLRTPHIINSGNIDFYKDQEWRIDCLNLIKNK